MTKAVLMLVGITEILLISTPQYIGDYKELLWDGSCIKIEYAVQEKPNGLGEDFIL